MEVESCLRKMGLVLPEPPEPVGNYQAFVRAGNLIFISGQLPLINGVLTHRGQVGSDLTLDEGYDAARTCALNVLAQIKKALGGFQRFRSIVRLDGYINAATGFNNLSDVLDGASDLFAQTLTERAGHSRSVAAHNGLPLNAAVEVVAIVEVE